MAEQTEMTSVEQRVQDSNAALAAMVASMVGIREAQRGRERVLRDSARACFARL